MVVIMIYFLSFCLLFFIGAIGGYLLELVFRRIVHHQWINPGFLVGPYLPLYGFGVVILFGIGRIFDLFEIQPLWLKDIVVILIMSFFMTLVEYITGLIFIKGMNIKLWDYSSRLGNIQGIICPLFSLAWTLVAALYYLLLDPYLLDWVLWLSSHLEFSFVIGLFAGVVIVDVGYSFKISSKIKKIAKDNKIVIGWENFKASIAQYSKKVKEKRKFLFPFHSKISLKELINNYKEKVAENKKK